MSTTQNQYRLYRFFEFNRLYNAYKNNLDYYKSQSNWERYVYAVKGIADDSSFKQIHLIKETTDELKMMFSMHDELIEEFIRMLYAELYLIISKSTPEETINYLFKELTPLNPV